LDPDALKLCENEILAAGLNGRTYSANTSYRTSLDNSVKGGFNPAWYFSTDLAFVLAVSDALLTTLTSSDPAYDPANHDYAQEHAANVQAIIENFNYQHGCNPLNLSFVTGSGWKRQRTIVNQ